MMAEMASPAVERFVDYFGELGQRWGLPAAACRVHAYLYLVARSVPETDLAAALRLEADDFRDALAFLIEYRMVDREAPASWRADGDPWDMLLRGLEQRRLRELPAALSVLRGCHREALAEKTAGRSLAGQIGKVLALVEDLAAIDAQAQRLSPRLLRGLVGISGRAARLADRAFRTGRGKG